MSRREAFVGAVDIGGTKIAVGLVDDTGAVVCRRTLNTSEYAGAATAVPSFCHALQLCLDEVDASISSIGISCTGPVDPVNGVIGRVANLPKWEGCSLVEMVKDVFNVPVAMENDADAAALAEARWGCGRGVQRFLYLTFSTGIGGGLILHGEVYRGRNGSHPKMGHHTIDPSGPSCYCGTHGCWESLASGSAIGAWFVANDSRQRFLSGQLSAETIFALHAQGDPVALQAISRLELYIGMGLANLTTILVPDVIALGEGLMKSSSVFLDAALTIFRRTCGEVPAEQTIVRKAARR